MNLHKSFLTLFKETWSVWANQTYGRKVPNQPPHMIQHTSSPHFLFFQLRSCTCSQALCDFSICWTVFLQISRWKDRNEANCDEKLVQNLQYGNWSWPHKHLEVFGNLIFLIQLARWNTSCQADTYHQRCYASNICCPWSIFNAVYRCDEILSSTRYSSLLQSNISLASKSDHQDSHI